MADSGAADVEVHLTTEIFLPDLPGGLRQFHRYAPGLRERGVQLVVHVKRRDHDRAGRFTDNAVEVITHQLPGALSHHRERELLLHAAAREIADARRRTHGRTRFCLQPNGTSWGSSAFLWRQRLRGLPSVFYSTMFPLDPPAGLYAAAKYRLRLRGLLSPFRRVFVCSHRIAAAFRSIAGVAPRRLAVFPNGVDPGVFSPPTDVAARRALRESLGLPPDRSIVLYAGSITPRKGVDLLVDAWRQLAEAGTADNALLVLAGSVGMRATFRDAGMRRELEEFTSRFEQQVASFPSPAALHLAGDVTEIADYYRAADAFAFPSLREGLPNAVLEAMASGLPCVISEFAGIPDPGEEFGDPGTHHLRVDHQPASIAAALADLLGDPARARSIGAAARRHMLATQAPDTTLDRIAHLYRNAAR